MNTTNDSLFQKSFGVKKIFFSKYTLQSPLLASTASAQTQRSGYLIRVIFESNESGYADLHAWPELGDLPVEDHLQSLLSAKPSKLALQSVAAAKVFSSLQKESMELQSPGNHCLLSDFHSSTQSEISSRIDSSLNRGFTRFKIKLNETQIRLTQERLIQLTRQFEGRAIKWRLDLNASMRESALMGMLQGFSSELLDSIDFLEDPVSARTPEIWHKIRSNWGLRLAADRERPEDTEAFDIYVVKPGVEDPFVLLQLAADTMKRVLFTSNLGHPLGLAYDLVHAAHAQTVHPLLLEEGGLLSHTYYPDAEFSNDFFQKGNRLGINTLQFKKWTVQLEARTWTPLL